MNDGHILFRKYQVDLIAFSAFKAVLGDITLLSKIKKTPLQQTTFNEMEKITTEASQRPIFKNIFVKSLERSVIYSDKIRATRLEGKFLQDIL